VRSVGVLERRKSAQQIYFFFSSQRSLIFPVTQVRSAKSKRRTRASQQKKKTWEMHWAPDGGRMLGREKGQKRKEKKPGRCTELPKAAGCSGCAADARPSASKLQTALARRSSCVQCGALEHRMWCVINTQDLYVTLTHALLQTPHCTHRLLLLSNLSNHIYIYTHTHAHIHIYMYIYMCVCIYVYTSYKYTDAVGELSNLVGGLTRKLLV
jgi:hypothetical protein